MLKCELTLTQMGCDADLNNSEMMLGIMDHLPLNLQTKWTKRAETIFKSGGRPRFSHLTWFFQQCADVANNMFGQHLSEAKSKEKSCSRFSQLKSRSETSRRGTTLAVRSSASENARESPCEIPRECPRERPRGSAHEEPWSTLTREFKCSPTREPTYYHTRDHTYRTMQDHTRRSTWQYTQ